MVKIEETPDEHFRATNPTVSADDAEEWEDDESDVGSDVVRIFPSLFSACVYAQTLGACPSYA